MEEQGIMRKYCHKKQGMQIYIRENKEQGIGERWTHVYMLSHSLKYRMHLIRVCVCVCGG